MIRPQLKIILNDLQKKRVLLVGPRQAGKTTLAKQVAKFYRNPIYLNYDQIRDHEIIQNQAWLPTADLLILDELHKMPSWKNYLKGLFDTRPNTLHLLITGSARLNTYDQVGDSLAGRYFRHRLLPLSLAELSQADVAADIDQLMKRGSFPEPFFAPSQLDADRWRAQYINSLLSTDIFEVDSIQNIKAFRTLFEMLRHRVGSTVSYQALSQDLAISPSTVKKYIDILEAVYVIFTVSPYHHNIARSLLKEPKIYFFDPALVESGEGATLENLVALSLLKSIYAGNDQLAEERKLQYLRTKEGHEVDFAISNKKAIEQIIEVKLSDTDIHKSLSYFKAKYQFNSIQLVRHITQEYQHKDIQILSLERYLKNLFI